MAQNYSVKYLEEKDFVEWDEFVEIAQGGTIFHTSYWLSNIFRFAGLNFSILACLDKSNRICGGIAFGFHSKMNLKIMVPPQVTPYYGIIIKPSESKYESKSESHLNQIVSILRAELDKRFNYVSMSFSPSIKDIRPFIWNGFNEQSRYSYLADISDLDLVYTGFINDIKRRIKKASELSYSIDNSETRENILAFYKLQDLSFSRQKHGFKIGESDFIELMSFLTSRGYASVNTVYSGNKPVSSNVTLYFRDTAYYWLSGSDPDELNSGLNQLLTWETIKSINKAGFKYFDFLGANTSTIAKYKSTFNFPLVNYFQVEKINGSMTKFLFALKNLLK